MEMPGPRVHRYSPDLKSPIASRATRKLLPKLVYALLKESDLRKRCREVGLYAKGDKRTLVARHQKYTLLYNTECDLEKPRSRIEITMQVEREEIAEKRGAGSTSTLATTSHQPSFQNSKIPAPRSSSVSQGNGMPQLNLRAPNVLPMAPRGAGSTHLTGEAMAAVGSGLAAYQFWPMAQNLHAMEQQRQQLWLPQPNLMYMAGTPPEYIRYMNEFRHMSVLPLLPIAPIPVSYPLPMQDEPLNLSLKDQFQDSNQVSSELSSSQFSVKSLDSSDSFSSERPKCADQNSPLRSSPLSVKLHPTKPIEVGSLDPDVARMFPYLRTTDMGSIVLWNFLWALLSDNNYQGIINWIDRPTLKFRVLHPQALARLWGTVKKNRAMNWGKLMKVIDLYLRKNILKQGDDKLMFNFVLIPQSPEFKKEI